MKEKISCKNKLKVLSLQTSTVKSAHTPKHKDVLSPASIFRMSLHRYWDALDKNMTTNNNKQLCKQQRRVKIDLWLRAKKKTNLRQSVNG